MRLFLPILHKVYQDLQSLRSSVDPKMFLLESYWKTPSGLISPLPELAKSNSHGKWRSMEWTIRRRYICTCRFDSHLIRMIHLYTACFVPKAILHVYSIGAIRPELQDNKNTIKHRWSTSQGTPLLGITRNSKICPSLIVSDFFLRVNFPHSSPIYKNHKKPVQPESKHWPEVYFTTLHKNTS